ncbi:hypothetical protein RDI58_018198 [Solanum bulbocastanum]|uniref:Uncharacterized protein n=1 Tax=Solanum bulbocastanum TaxID=147425 RepID=A0AAN8TA82_SOLBU
MWNHQLLNLCQKGQERLEIKSVRSKKEFEKLPRKGVYMTCSISHGKNHNKRSCPLKDFVAAGSSNEAGTSRALPEPRESRFINLEEVKERHLLLLLRHLLLLEKLLNLGEGQENQMLILMHLLELGEGKKKTIILMLRHLQEAEEGLVNLLHH